MSQQLREPSVEVINDARLMELAREPVRELFPTLRRDSAMSPLIVLLAFMPGLLVFWNPTLNEATCQQGLLALDVAVGERPMDWIVTATRESLTNSSAAFPVAILLTSLGLKVDLLGPEARLLLVSYASSVLLLLCLCSLAKKWGGSRFALLVVLLACGHREFLALSGALPPAALSLAFAVLSFRGMLAHQASDAPMVSWSLVVSGLALAACWLAGGELAIAGWCVLLAMSVFVGCRMESVSRATLGRAIRQRLSHFAITVLSFIFVTAIALVVVVGWQFIFSGKMSLPDFDGCASWFERIWPTASRATSASQALLKISGAWLGFVLLGVMRIARGRLLTRDGESEYGVLACWSAVALLSWWMTWPVHQGGFTDSVAWPGFLLLPMLFLAAWGLEAVLRREFGLGSVLTATIVTVGVLSAPYWPTRMLSSLSGSWLAVGVLVAGLAIFAGLRLYHRVAQSELHSRCVLLSCVAILVLADVANGIDSRPQLADDERELLALRRQLMDATQPNECWLLTEEASPARLRFFLRSLWRGVAFREAKNWEAVLAEPQRKSPRKPITERTPVKVIAPRAIVVTWGNPKFPAEDLRRRGQVLTQATAPHYFRGRLIKGFRWSARSELSRTP